MSRRTVAILFDIDGTLISSGGAGTRAWAMAFDDAYGVSVDISEFSDLGMTDPEVGIKSFEGLKGRKPDAEELTALLERHVRYLKQTVRESEGYRILNGVEELLIQLVSMGYLLGLVSGNSEKGAHIKLHRANLNRFFAFGGFGSDSADRNELAKTAIVRAEMTFGSQIALDEFLYVGDTPRDVEAAHAVGIKSVGVATSKFTTDDLRNAGADHVIGSLKEGLPI